MYKIVLIRKVQSPLLISVKQYLWRRPFHIHCLSFCTAVLLTFYFCLDYPAVWYSLFSSVSAHCLRICLLLKNIGHPWLTGTCLALVCQFQNFTSSAGWNTEPPSSVGLLPQEVLQVSMYLMNTATLPPPPPGQAQKKKKSERLLKRTCATKDKRCRRKRGGCHEIFEKEPVDATCNQFL